jgi:hypothetical protein
MKKLAANDGTCHSSHKMLSLLAPENENKLPSSSGVKALDYPAGGINCP